MTYKQLNISFFKNANFDVSQSTQITLVRLRSLCDKCLFPLCVSAAQVSPLTASLTAASHRALIVGLPSGRGLFVLGVCPAQPSTLPRPHSLRQCSLHPQLKSGPGNRTTHNLTDASTRDEGLFCEIKSLEVIDIKSRNGQPVMLTASKLLDKTLVLVEVADGRE